MLGCASFRDAGRYNGNFIGSDVIGVQTPYAAAACDGMMQHGLDGQWESNNVTLRVGSTGAVVDLRFYWLRWPHAIYETSWFNSTVLTGDFDVALLNSYLHLHHVPGGTLDMYYGWIDELLARLAAAPEPIAAKLRRRFWWRATLPLEWWADTPHLFQPSTAAEASAVVVRKWRAAGFPAVEMDKYVLSKHNCSAALRKRGCVTGDGLHGIMATNLVVNRELWSVVADALDSEAAAR